LVVIYGTFIPNTWKRCALVVGILAGLPILLTLVFGGFQPLLWPHLLEVLIAMVLLMGIASAVAVFGSYKISELHQKAIEAEQIGQYKLGRPLGLGGMGEVYLAEHVLLLRQCAIKVIRPDQVGEPTILTRFEREVRSTAKLTHPNTVEIFDYGRDDDGTFYYVMEYLPGLTLETMVEKYGPLPPGRAVRFLRQLCGALREAHEKDLIHRDVKPSNVLVCERGGVHDVAKLLDFGLVQRPPLEAADEKLTMHGTVLGSPPYMSPEQAAGKDADARSDIYCLGGVGYFLLTGQPPFVRETAMQMLLAHAYEAPKPPRSLRPEVPEDLERVVLTCLEKDPEKRYQDAKSLDRALAECDCADDWSEEQARAWWRRHPVEESVAATTPTANPIEATPV
jgi:serine/threonine-protein kinase